jgi:hypothetical protein
MPRTKKKSQNNTIVRSKDKSYLNNSNLKAAGVKIEFTPDQVKEYIRCSKDPIYFIKKYVKIVNLDKGLVSFDLRDYQQDMIKKMSENRFVIAKLPRQCGKSITVISYLMHYILFNQNVNVAILANKQKTATDLLSRLKLAYEWLPKWLQQGIVEWNKGSIVLENGSKIIASSTSASAVRGGSFNIIVLDEFAFVPEHIADEFFSSVYPTISSGTTTKMFIISTPNGMNMFYKMWSNSINKRNSFVPIEVHWSQIPGRDAEWAQKEIANTSQEQFDREQNCEFLGSVHTLISPAKLKTMTFQEPIFKNEIGYKIYEMPKPKNIYAMCVDTSSGQGYDYHAFSIIDITTVPYKLVASFRNNQMSHLLYPTVLFNAGNQFNKAYMLIEINNEGNEIANIMHSEMEYDNIVMVSHRGRRGQQVDGGFGATQVQYGVRTSEVVKRLGCSILKSMIEENKLIIEDFDTVKELFTFVAKKSSFEAESGYNDDLVMTLVLFGWLMSQPYFKEITNVDITKAMYEKKMEQIEENMTPFGFIDNGILEEDNIFRDSSGTVWQVVSE